MQDLVIPILLALFAGSGGGIAIERYRHRKALRQRGADVLGPIGRLLIDANPDRLAINLDRAHPFDPLKAIWERSRVCDEQLQTLAIELSPPGSEYADDLPGAIQRSLSQTNFLLNCLVTPMYMQNYDLLQAAADAQAAHAEAQGLLDALKAGLRRM